MNERVLCVDDDPLILQAFERQFRNEFDLTTAIGPTQALAKVDSEGPFAVVVTDLRMPVMDGIEFLSRVSRSSPDTVRIMLTGNADLGTSIAAVNEGKVFQILTKPCPAEMFARTLNAALKQHQLITAERELLEETLRGSIGVMTEILSLVNPAAFSRAQRIRRYVHHMAEKLTISDAWQFELAAMLSQVGCVTVPPHVLEKSHTGEPLAPAEQRILAAQSETAHKLLVKIPRLSKLAEMIALQGASWPETEGVAEPIRTGAHLLKIALDFDEQLMRGVTPESAVLMMHRSRDYNPALVVALREIQVEESANETQLLTLSQLRPRMIVNASIYSKTGVLLLARGQEVTESAIARLESFASLFGIVEPISVMLPAAARQQTFPTSAVA